MKVLFIGNSITMHSPAPDIGWYGNYGMAASCEENDYVHTLCRLIEQRGKKVDALVYNAADFERNPESFDLVTLSNLRDFQADIIIVRLIENVPREKLQSFGAAYVKLLEYINKNRRGKVFCTGSFWKNEWGDKILREAASEYGASFISLEMVQSGEFQAIGQFEHSGVAAHPSDKGMQAIAEIIYREVLRSGALERAKVAPVPTGVKSTEYYTVKVDGIKAPCYECRVSAMPFNRVWPGSQRPLDQTELAAFTVFEMSSPVTVEVTATKEFKNVVIRPLSRGITPTLSGNKIEFTIDRPGQFSLELDGRHNNLHIFADPAEQYEDKEKADYYFGPGVHHVGRIELKSNQTMYVDSGAVVYASVKAEDAENVKIIGHGVIDCGELERHDPLVWETDGLMNFIRCKNVTVDGVILKDSNWWSITAANCEWVDIHNVKTIGMWRYNTDGFDFVNSRNVHVSDCFLRNFDDVIVLKGLRVHNIAPDGSKIPLHYEHINMENYLIERCVVWCDWGGALEFGAETVADEYRNITFRDIDIIQNVGGGLRIQSGDRATIHDVLYENIRVEYSADIRACVYQSSDDMVYAPEDVPSVPALICGWMYCNMWTDDGILGNIYDVKYKDIYVYADEGISVPAISFTSADENHKFDNIVIDGVYFNGKRLQTKEEANIITNAYTGKIDFI
jgi:hypothetical protein